jgi:hypothetical protein
VEAVDVLPGAHEQLAGVTGRDAQEPDRPRRCNCDELSELTVQRRDLMVERFDPLRG